MKQTLHMLFTLLLLFVYGGVCMGQETVTYTVASATSVTASTKIDGVTTTFKNTYTSNKEQLTNGNSMTLTIKGYPYIVKQIILNLHRNSSKGDGTLTMTIGGNSVLNNTINKTDITNEYVKYTYDIASYSATGDIVIKLSANNNSLYCNSFTIVPVEKTSTTLSFGADFDNKTITKNANDIFETPATLSPTIEGATITYNSSNPDVAEIDKDGNVFVYQAGTTTITASYAGDTKYKESSVSYTLNVVDNRTETSLSFGEDIDGKTIVKYVGDEFTQKATLLPDIEGATITYESSDKDVAEIEDGYVYMYKEGSTTITASYAGDTKYKASSVSYTLNVVDNRTETTLTFPTSSYSYTQGDNDGEDLIENPVTISTSGISADKIKYTVTGTTGIVEGNIDTDGIVVINTNVVGTATITATFDGDKNHKPATASYTITVKKNAIAEDGIFDFSKPENYGYNSLITGGTTLAVGTKITAGNIILEIKKKGTNDASWWYDGVLRIYKNSEHELSVTDGYHITSVTIAPTESKYANYKIQGGAIGANWTGSAKTVSIVNDGNNNSRIKSITVTYEKDIELTTAASGFATYAANYDVNYKELGLTAYAVKISNDNTKVSYTKLEDAVPANTPVLVQGASEQTVALTPASTTASSVDTDLKMSDGNIVGDGSLIYGFTTKNGVSGFYRVQNGLAVPANKGYIQLSSAPASETKFFSFDGGDGTTGIGNIENIEKQIMLDNATIYNLAGQRVSKDYKGVIIVNGKKMVNK